MARYQSWGCYPKTQRQQVHPILWAHEAPQFETLESSVLPHAYGRSYGDSCLNEGGILLDTISLNRFLSFDASTGILKCESGVSLQEILKVVISHGWFIPVTPGTQFVSIGGAIANDVHGKNHHRSGTFGCHVNSMEILRSDGTRMYCSRTENPEWFRATVGGLGLTGLILWAEIQLTHIRSPWILAERLKFSHLEEFFLLSSSSEKDFEYTVAWIDCFAPENNLGRGIFIRGNHGNAQNSPTHTPKSRKYLQVPCNFPSCFLNPAALKLFNALYYHSRPFSSELKNETYEQFFYPLDSILNWNRLYGTFGFLQHQCVIPPEHQKEGIYALLAKIKNSGQGSFLAVLKQFGSISSPGLLSFPRPGTTLALDFAFQGARTLDLLASLDEIVLQYGGAVYPAKDARMSASNFQRFFPQWKTLIQFVDPKFSSSFWRRVTTSHTSHGLMEEPSGRLLDPLSKSENTLISMP